MQFLCISGGSIWRFSGRTPLQLEPVSLWLLASNNGLRSFWFCCFWRVTIISWSRSFCLNINFDLWLQFQKSLHPQPPCQVTPPSANELRDFCDSLPDDETPMMRFYNFTSSVNTKQDRNPFDFFFSLWSDSETSCKFSSPAIPLSLITFCNLRYFLTHLHLI